MQPLLIADATDPLHNLAAVLIEKNQAFDIETDETGPGRIVIRAKPNEFLSAILREIRMTEKPVLPPLAFLNHDANPPDGHKSLDVNSALHRFAASRRMFSKVKRRQTK